MCPESGKDNEHSAGFSGKRADIWALGVTLFAFTYNVVPFDGENILEILENIEKQLFIFCLNYNKLNKIKIRVTKNKGNI